jgi:hypothetical protein
MADCFPTKDADFAEWIQNFAELCTANQAKWGLPLEETTKICTAIVEYKSAYELAIGPTATKADILLKNEEKIALKKAIREFKRRYIDPNKAITDPDRERLRLPIHDIKPTPIPPPSSVPEFEFTYPGARRLDVHFKDFGSASKAKPKGVAGAVIMYEVRDVPPLNQEALLHSIFTGRTPHHFEFKEEERGKIFYAALFWQNAKGDRGPWSEIQSAIIP